MALKIALTVASAAEIPSWFAVVMGIGTVFTGLICLVIICKILGAVSGAKKAEEKKAFNPPATVTETQINNREEIIAAVTAVCAENMGKDVSALRVVSFKKL